MANELSTSLKNRTTYWAGKMTSLARSFAPNHLKNFIHSKTNEPREGVFTIRTYVDDKNPTRPGHPNYGTSDARAQEFGSGLRAKRGAKEKYTITPKNSPFLEFLGTNEFDGWLIRTQKVEHPGIKAANQGKGYIHPAAQEVRKLMKKDLKKTGREAIKLTLRNGFNWKK